MPANRVVLILFGIAALVLIALMGGLGGMQLSQPSTANGDTVAPSPQARQEQQPVALQPTDQAPQAATSPQAVEPGPAPAAHAPTSAAALAAEFGGSASQWSHGPDEHGRTVGPNGWIYRSYGAAPLHFTVPDGCVVDTPTGQLQAGEAVAAADLTIYWP